MKTFIDFQPICQDYSCHRIFILNVFLNHFMAIFDIVLIQLLLDLCPSLEKRKFCLQLCILFLQSSNDDSWVDCLVSFDIVFYQGNPLSELTCSNTFGYIFLFGRHGRYHSCFTITTQRIPENECH